MKIPRLKNATYARQTLDLLSRHLPLSARTLFHEIEKELRRLNSARMGEAELSRLEPRDRARAVKSALAAHHRNSARCC